MKRTSSAQQKLLQRTYLFLCFISISFSSVFNAEAYQPTSMRQPHPLGWMHALPVGEQPGWITEKWAFVELGNANVWSAPLRMRNKKTGDTYDYRADYEQISLIAEVGAAVNKRLAVSMELPIAYRAGGFMDGLVDEVHQQLGTRTFNREMYGKDEYHYSIKTNGEEAVTSGPLKSISNVKPKIKYWFQKIESSTNPCPCGGAVSAQLKIPMQNDSYGAANGKLEPSLLLHYGLPLFSTGAVWLTAAYTRMSPDPQMKGWPLRRDHQMYEASFDVGVTDRWGILFQARMDSPFMKVSDLEYVDITGAATSKDYIKARAATSWNAMVRWQGMEAAGLRYKDKDTQLNLLVAEDWGFGPYDAADQIYSNNSPDINFVFQASFGF